MFTKSRVIVTVFAIFLALLLCFAVLANKGYIEKGETAFRILQELDAPRPSFLIGYCIGYCGERHLSTSSAAQIDVADAWGKVQFTVEPTIPGSSYDTPAPLPATQPAWSHDGKRVAFVCPLSRWGGTTICVDGGTRLLPSGGSDWNPAWSPDDRMIAFGSSRDWRYGYQSSIWVVNADGSNLKRLTWGSLDASPSWSPDGKQIVFESGGLASELHTVSLDLTENVLLSCTPGCDLSNSFPSWSPDGTKIAFGNNGQICIASSSGVRESCLFGPSNPYGNRLLGGISWSPDNKWIAFSVDYEIYIVPVDGSQVAIKVTAGWYPTWLAK